jgi:hypothetical protein
LLNMIDSWREFLHKKDKDEDLNIIKKEED